MYALGEVNWYHWMNDGQDGALVGIEGNDLFNFGSPGVAGNDIPVRADAVCVHSDTPNAVAIAQAVKRALAPYMDRAA